MSRSEWKEPHRVAAHEEVSRAIPLLQEVRRPPVETLPRTSVSFLRTPILPDLLKSYSQREPPRRQIDMSRPPPTAPMPKLSGTNSMPVGGRGNRFGGSASISPHPVLSPAPLPLPVTPAPRRDINVPGSNMQPVSRSARPASGAREIYERPVCCTSVQLYLLLLT